jgi:hypothetical protein
LTWRCFFGRFLPSQGGDFMWCLESLIAMNKKAEEIYFQKKNSSFENQKFEFKKEIELKNQSLNVKKFYKKDLKNYGSF